MKVRKNKKKKRLLGEEGVAVRVLMERLMQDENDERAF